MIWLDANDHVISYTYEKEVIQYVSNKKTGKLRKYYPDFLIEYKDRKEMVEIKPSRRVCQAKVQKKLLAAVEWCKNNNIIFRVVTEVELKALGLI